jgi:peptidoglycan/xylan/chitin deacetylase (PgdA/CDA1 family)
VAVVLVAACSALPTVPPTGTPGATVSPSPSPSPSATPSPTPEPTITPPTATPSATPIAPTANGILTLPILYGHHVVDVPLDVSTWSSQKVHDTLPYLVTPCEFSADLDWLSANGYTTILPRDLTAYWDKGRPLPGRPIIITFDDGSADWRPTILPLLQAHGFVAEFYVTVDHIGGAISGADVRALVAAGMGIGAHDMNHFQLAGGGVTTASVATMTYQVSQARAVLQSTLGVPIDSMAYVGGGFDATLEHIVRVAGYSSARAILRGVVQSPASRYLLHVSRIGLFDDVLSKTLADAMACNLDPAMADFQARVTGTDPG